MDKITELKQKSNLYTDISGRWANQAGVEKFTQALVEDIVLFLTQNGSMEAAKQVALMYGTK
jgi:hypothetical protein